MYACFCQRLSGLRYIMHCVTSNQDDKGVFKYIIIGPDSLEFPAAFSDTY